MSWIRDWKKRRILQSHAIDDALRRRVVGVLPFLAGLPAHDAARTGLPTNILLQFRLSPCGGRETGIRTYLSY
jgi:hypothetical protein